jgi:hypothetical protein
LTWSEENADGFGDTGNIGIGSMTSFGYDLYVGTVNQMEGCEIWRVQLTIFDDSFESGDTSRWSSTTP